MDIDDPDSRAQALIEQYDPVGQEHNLALDKMLSEYRSQEGILTKAACQAIADRQFPDAGDMAGRMMSWIGSRHDLAKASINADVVDVLADSIEIFAAYPEIFDPMTDILDATLDVTDKIERLEELYLLIDDKVDNPDDRESLMNGLSTTIHSLAYWSENYQAWQSTLGADLGKTTLGIAGAIGIIDGAGAVIGTLEGIRDTYKGQEGRVRIIIGRAVGEAAKTSTYVVLTMLLL
jgi:hypothetical protein